MKLTPSSAIIRFLLALATACLFTLAVPAAAPLEVHSKVKLEPTPDWVQDSPINWTIENPQDAQYGVHYLLNDVQVNATTQQSYTRFVKKITSRAGLQAQSQLSIEFHPAYQELFIHSLKIHRENEIINLLSNQKFHVVQQEKDLERYVFNGSLACMAFLENTRVGDVIECAFSLRGFNPVFSGKYVDTFAVNSTVPISANRIRILHPSIKDLQFWENGVKSRRSGSNSSPEVKELSWLFTNLRPIKLEERLPVGFEAFEQIRVSEFEDWGEVASWAKGLFELPAELPEELLQIVEPWKSLSSPEEKAAAATRWVQDEIRYLGITIGINTHRPHDLKTILARRFGDCKDKTVLLCAMLKEIGIEASPLLINVYWVASFAERLPTPLAFNHAAVIIYTSKFAYCVDATMKGQRGSLADLHMPVYEKGVAVSPINRQTAFPGNERTPSRKIVEETFNFSDFSSPLLLQVKTFMSGDEAVNFRYLTLNSSRSDLEKFFLNYYEKQFSQVTVAQSLKITDDEAANIVTVEESYHVEQPQPTEPGKNPYIRLTAFNINEATQQPNTYSREYPLAISYPKDVEHVITVNVPKGNFTPESVQISDKYQDFSFLAKPSRDYLSLKYKYKTKSEMVSVQDLPDFRKSLDKIHAATSYLIQLPRNGKTAGSIELNWAIIGVIAPLLLCLLFLFWKMWNLPPLPSISAVIEAPQTLKGLGGWLILVGLGLVLTPFFSLNEMSGMGWMFQQASWASPLQLQNQPGILPVFLWISYMLLLVGVFLLTILTLKNFFKKHQNFPRFYVAWQCGLVGQALIGLLCISGIAKEKDSAEQMKILVQSIIGAVIWSAYVIKSKRVKATFTEPEILTSALPPVLVTDVSDSYKAEPARDSFE